MIFFRRVSGVYSVSVLYYAKMGFLMGSLAVLVSSVRGGGRLFYSVLQRVGCQIGGLLPDQQFM